MCRNAVDALARPAVSGARFSADELAPRRQPPIFLPLARKKTLAAAKLEHPAGSVHARDPSRPSSDGVAEPS